MDRVETITEAVKVTIDKWPVGYQFHGNKLKETALRLCPQFRYAYPDTFLRLARRWRRDSFKVVNRNKSLYEKVDSKASAAHSG